MGPQDQRYLQQPVTYANNGMNWVDGDEGLIVIQ